jgi:hypothetical protein
MRLTRTLAHGAVAAGLATLATLTAAPAYAFSGGGTTNDNGYGARVEVHLSGDVSHGLVASVPGPPPMCWFENLSTTLLDTDKVDTSDPAAVKKYYNEEVRPWLTGHAAVGQLSMPDGDYFNSIIKQVAAGKDMTFYSLQTREDAISAKPGSAAYAGQVHAVGKACGAPVVDGPYGPLTVGWQAFPTGQEPPPAVAPEDLAAYAYEVMDLRRPALEWNPRLASADDATLVNLPTWLWTRDPAAVEERQVTAEAAGISVTVTAEPGGMTVTSPVAGTECTAEQARTAYAPGVDEASACVLTFPSGSLGYGAGFPVQSVTGWQASWTSNAGAGGDLEPKTRSASTTIPVIEVQSRVSSVS